MQKLHFSITINAPKEKVWGSMLEDATYRVWTGAFSPGSYYEGDWNEGSKILFLGPDPSNPPVHGSTKGVSGMVSRIRTNRPYEYISIEHLGIVQNGEEDTTSEAAKKWSPAFENYMFQEHNGVTELAIDLHVADEYVDMFNTMWPKALAKLKEIAESGGLSPITVEAVVHAPMEKVWEFWTKPEHITHWAFASDDWEAPHAENDIRTGGRFSTTMAARDGSSTFDFTGVYTDVREHERIEYDMDKAPNEAANRHVKTIFTPEKDGVRITQTFDPENKNPQEVQRTGWQAILDNFKKYVEVE
jgi:uncharacterized protein YndB with AHSA1/START domain